MGAGLIVKNIKSIAIVGPLPPPAGGMANLTRKLVELLELEGLNVQLIQMNKPYKPSWIGKLTGVRAVFRLLPYFFSLYRQIKHVDIVHIMANSGWSWHLFSAPAILVSRLHGKPIVVNYHGGGAGAFFSRSWKWVHLSIRHVEKVIVPSSFLANVFTQYHQKTDIIPNVLDTSLFSKSTRRFADNGLHFIVTRNLEKIYGVDTVINAFNIVNKEYPESRLTIAGTGPELEVLRQQVSELQLDNNVTFSGRLTPIEMAALYQSADIMLNASLVDNAPSALLEALSCGIPVISTDTGGIPDMVTHLQDAILIKQDDCKEMSERILQLVEDDLLRETLITNGLEAVKHFHWHQVWKKLSRSYQQAVDKKFGSQTESLQ